MTIGASRFCFCAATNFAIDWFSVALWIDFYRLVIRGIALGTLNNRTRGQFLVRELKMAATLSLILSVAGFARTICFRTPLPEAITVTAALSLIVFSN